MSEINQQARARHSDPAESHQAAASVGKLTDNQRAVLVVLRMVGRALTDEELVTAYQGSYQRLHLPRQSESGIRSRRAELGRRGRLRQGKNSKTSGGRSCRTWAIEEVGNG